MRNRKRKTVGFIDLEKVYDRVNREALWQVLRIYDVGVNLGGIKSMYVDILACVRVKGVESEWFRIVERNRVASYVSGFSMYIWVQ